MSRSDRLLRLMQALRSQRPPVSASSLAQHLGVSRRTVYRDVEGLRAAGAVIEGEAGYGYRLIDDGALPPQALSRLETEAVALGLSIVAQIGDGSLADAARDASAKIVASVPEPRRREALHAVLMVHLFERRPEPVVSLDLLREACWEETALEIDYVDKAGAKSRREIEPLALAYLDRSLALLAWCTLRQDFRTFMADRIRAARSTGRSFRPRRVAMLRERLAQLSG